MTEIEEDYSPDDSIFSGETILMNRIKHIIKDELSEVDRRVILLYSETGSQRDTAKILGVSASTANIRINEIRNKIKEKLYGSNSD